LCVGEEEDRWFSESTGNSIESCLYWLVIPFAFVYVGARIAPKFQLAVAVALTTLILLGVALILGHALLIDGYSIVGTWRFLLFALLLFLGLGCGIFGTARGA